MDYEFINLDIAGEVATVTLEREPGNLLNLGMIEEINAAVLSLRDHAALEVMVLRGARGQFCHGLDLADHGPRSVQRLVQLFMRIFETLRMMPVISVAAVQGRAYGGGFELALGCNLIIASDSAEFALPQVRQGIIPPVASAVLPRIAPRRKAMEWILTGDPIPAARLEHDGVINCLVPDRSFDMELRAFVARITEKSGPVLQLARRAQFEAYYTSFPDALANIQALYLKELMSLEDAKEGLKAAREGREPVWRNC
jgi:enoyl-CoA hydratase/carnithine racemase